MGWGLSGREVSGEGPGPDSPSPRGWVCRVKAESQLLQRPQGSPSAPGFPSPGCWLEAWGGGDWARALGSKGTVQNLWAVTWVTGGDVLGVGVQGSLEPQRQPAAMGWAQAAAPTSAHLPHPAAKRF